MDDGNNAAPALPVGIDIRYLAQLGEDAADVKQISVTTKGLGEGLPETVPVLWNRRMARVDGLRPAIEAWRKRPERREGTARALTLQSFIELVKRHKDKHSAIFANTNWKDPGFTCVLDYHEAEGEPRHGKHRISYDFPLSEEWQQWMQANGQVMEQAEFAAFIEDRIAELASPTDGDVSHYEPLFQTKFATPSELIQLSRGLQVMVNTEVKSAQTLQSGEAQIVFAEAHADAGGNALTVPGLFMIKVPVFFQGEPVEIPTRLRYRARGSIKWFFQMYRPDYWVTDRIRQDMERAAKETGLPAFEGAPEMAGARIGD